MLTCFYYRDPRVYALIRDAIQPDGWLFYETYTAEASRSSMGTKNPAYLLRPGELLQAFGDWRVVYFREGSEGGTARLVARKPTG